MTAFFSVSDFWRFVFSRKPPFSIYEGDFMDNKPLSICSSCVYSASGCILYRFIDTNDYFGCPNYEVFPDSFIDDLDGLSDSDFETVVFPDLPF